MFESLGGAEDGESKGPQKQAGQEEQLANYLYYKEMGWDRYKVGAHTFLFHPREGSSPLTLHVSGLLVVLEMRHRRPS